MGGRADVRFAEVAARALLDDKVSRILAEHSKQYEEAELVVDHVDYEKALDEVEIGFIDKSWESLLVITPREYPLYKEYRDSYKRRCRQK